MLNEVSYTRSLSHTGKNKIITPQSLHSSVNSITLTIGIKRPNFVEDGFRSHKLVLFFSGHNIYIYVKTCV